MTKKIFLLLSLISCSIFSTTSCHVAPEVAKLRQKFDQKEKIAFSTDLVPAAWLGTTIITVYNAGGRLEPVGPCAFTFGCVYLGLKIWNFIETFKARRLFKYLSNKKISPSGELIDGELTNAYPYLLSDEQFHVLGIKAGFTETELVKLAKESGRIDLAYKLRAFTHSPYQYQF